MIPKIEFKYSWIYDQKWQNWMKHGPYPSTKKTLDYIKKVEPLWRKEEKRIFNEMSKVTGLKWAEKSVLCYVVGRAMPFSDPLTLAAFDDKKWFIDTLTHEMIHQLFFQGRNGKRLDKVWDYFMDKYKKEDRVTIIHIPLQAIHSHIYLKLFGKKRMENDIKTMSYYPAYKRSWEIVQKEGYQNIIKELTRRIQ